MKLSVIVCTRNRAHAVIECLNSIEHALSQAMPVDAEIVVIDNASIDDTASILKEWATQCAFPVQIQLETALGISNARNCGLRAAKGELIIITDDDCRLQEDHIAVALRHDETDKELILRGGRIELGDKKDLPLTIITRPNPGHWSKNLRSARHENLGNAIFGCNMAMKRGIFEKLGPFDTRLGAGSPIPGGEDIDYVFRAYLAGIPIEYAPDMVAYHFHGRKTPEEGYKLFHNYCIGGGAIYAKYFF